ncbi:MAG: cell division septation protein DedD [Brevundimonas sp.]|jgi:cell division septation protein DedD|uniref:SPOR domain-containing protein n=1 Tax=Brevundimonas sp. TaxID=1871086 RepID=UPI0024899BED|nr:SPOR domain-containing protein [Brevundimonas sp.]MDI1279893.1 SPOR domain-containing protein [Brevundimonas sp.]
MSHEDPYRPNAGGDRDRGAYTPPTDDDLPFQRNSYDARRAGGSQAGGAGKAPPVTLIISGAVLLLLIIAVVIFYRSGLRSSTDAPPAVGTPIGDLKVEAPQDAQPIDPEAGVSVYGPPSEIPADPTFIAPPEAVQPRPVAPTAPAPVATTPAPATKVETRPAPVGGSSIVQIGAFSTPGIADREYSAVAARFPQFAAGATKRVQEVTASNGSTVYRTTFTGLSRDDARAFCAAIKAGGGDCLVR